MSKELKLYGSALVSIFNFNFDRQYCSPNCHSKVATFTSTFVLDSILFMSDLNALGVSIRPIGTPNRPYCHLIALMEGGGLGSPTGGRKYAIAIEGEFRCSMAPRGVFRWLF
jgi:hypothetical protein